MLVIENQEHYDKVLAFAKKVGLEDDLQQRLDYLTHYACQDDPEHTRCLLYWDFAPYSFAFTMEVKRDGEYKRWFNGGLIFHGQHDKGGADGSAPTFACSLVPCTGWMIHT